MRKAKRALALFAGLFVFMSSAAAIAADDSGMRFTEGTIDPGMTCSVTIKEYVSNNGDASLAIDGNIIGAEGLLPDGAKPVCDAEFYYMKIADLDAREHGVHGNADNMYSGLSPRFLDLMEDLRILSEGEIADCTSATEIDALVQKAAVISEGKVRSLVRTYGQRIPATDDNGITKTEGLSPGLYLCAETKCPDGYVPGSPFCLALPQTNISEMTVGSTTYGPGQIWLYDLTVFPKNRSVSIDKKIVLKCKDENEETAGEQYAGSCSACIGDTITYEITSDVPKLSKGVKNRFYNICDTMDDGLSLSGEISVSLGDDRASGRELTNGSDYKVTTAGNPGSLQITLTERGLARLDRVHTLSHIYVRYDAVLEKNAVIADPGNKNIAVLTYGTDRSEDTQVSSGPVPVYTYMLNVKKTFTPEKDHFGKVRFSIKKDKGKMLFAQESDGIYHVACPDEENTVTLISPNDTTGLLHIKGLADGTYILTEEETIPGYSLLGESVELLIRGRNITVDVENKKSIDLLHTGGEGLLLSSLASCALVAVGAWITFSERKSRKK